MSIRLEAANSESLSITTGMTGDQDWTWGGWFYLHSLPGAGLYAPILSVFAASFSGFTVEVDNSGNLVIWGENGGDRFTGSTTLSVDTWYYLWVYYDHSLTESHAFLDESETAEVSHTAHSVVDPIAEMELGANDASTGTLAYGDLSLVGWKAWDGAAFLAASEAANESGDCVMNTTTDAFAEWPLPDHTDIADQRNSNDWTAGGTLSAGATDPVGYSCGGSSALPAMMRHYYN